MKFIFRVLALLIVLPAAYYFVYWVPLSFLALFIKQRWIPEVVALLCTLAIGWFVWQKLGSGKQGLVTSSLIGAIVFGAIGFNAGFFGPLIFAPEASQGPLLGLFITGPLGFFLGGAGI